MKKLSTLILALSLFNLVSWSQESSTLDQAKSFDVKLKTEEALKLYDQALEIDPKNVSVLVRCAELNAFLGNAQKEPAQKMPFYEKAKVYADKALVADSTSSLSNYSMALVLGCLINFTPLKEKGPVSRQVYEYASKSLKADSNYAKAIHLLANWNNEMASLNPAAKTALKIFFKDLPKASQEEAIFLYEKARKLDPSMISNNFHLSEIYKKIGRSDLSVDILKTTIKLAPKSIEDLDYKNRSRALLESLK